MLIRNEIFDIDTIRRLRKVLLILCRVQKKDQCEYFIVSDILDVIYNI